MKKKIVKFIIILIIIIITLGIFLIYMKDNEKTLENKYVSGDFPKVDVLTMDKEKKSLVRGSSVILYDYNEKIADNIYVKIKYKDTFYLINKENLVDNLKDTVKESEMYVRTNLTIYEKSDNINILSYAKKGEKLKILGFDKLNEDGTVNKYKIEYGNVKGYVYSKYLVNTYEESIKVYDENNIQEYMEKMGNSLGAGDATTLDYYPREKPKFENNVMPDEVRALYINSGAIKNIDEYIDFALNNNINAFVIDIKDNTSPAYNSPVMEKYSITNYNHALNDYEKYKEYVKRAKDKGFYLIGRITTFKDSYYAMDHPDETILSSNGEPFSHNGSYWPSVYKRGVWMFNVELAKEAVTEIGFNEIQFDYVRFPDRTTNLERAGSINLGNSYDETKSEAIQTFVMYAADALHEVNAYISVDVFGESASNYVTAYGQFWPAISNVVDVISGMPYPDHFNAHEYGISEVVWTVPYKLLDAWSKYVVSKQEVIPTPAIVRTWIQTYNSTKTPSVVYDSNKVSDQIQALYDNGLTGGFMTWNSSSNMVKYKEVSYSFKKVYK